MAVTRGLQGMPTVDHCERKEITPVIATVKNKSTQILDAMFLDYHDFTYPV